MIGTKGVDVKLGKIGILGVSPMAIYRATVRELVTRDVYYEVEADNLEEAKDFLESGETRTETRHRDIDVALRTITSPILEEV